MSAPWLEDLVWADVKRFVTNPGEVLERVRGQLQDEGDTEDLSTRLEGLEKRLAAIQDEKDKYIRLYAQGHIAEDDIESYLVELKNQIGNLRLQIEATEADLSQRRERVQVADTTVAWLNLLRERAEENEEATLEPFVKRQQLVRLLVERIALHRGEGRKTTVVITYRFGPPDDRAEVEAGVVGNVRNSEEFPKERKKL
jgi:chromosome segregation ATPase